MAVTKLSDTMLAALETLYTGADEPIKPQTMQALEKRSLVEGGELTPAARELVAVRFPDLVPEHSGPDVPSEPEPEPALPVVYELGFQLKTPIGLRKSPGLAPMRVDVGTFIKLLRTVTGKSKLDTRMPYVCSYEAFGTFRLGKGHPQVRRNRDTGEIVEGWHDAEETETDLEEPAGS